MRWRQNPQRVAWIILIANFTACCFLTVAVPVAARSFVLHATRPLAAYLTTTQGTVQLRTPGASDPNAVPDGVERREVLEGSQIATDNTAQALLVISSDKAGQRVLTQLQLFPNSSLRITQFRSPRFSFSRDLYDLDLVLEKGRVRVAATDGDRAVQVSLETPQGTTYFGDGTMDIVVRDSESQITTLSGSAQVLAAGTEVTAGAGQRVVVSAGRVPGLPVPAEQNLVRNGAFSTDLTPSWEKVVEIDSDHQPGEVSLTTVGERPAARFWRRAEDSAPNMIGVLQVLNQDVQGLDSLVLQLDVQILNQSVPAGGWRASEYPVMVDLAYTDIYGKSLHWRHNFYWYDLPPGSTWDRPTTDSEKIPLGVWYTFESKNLIEELRDTRPARLNSITISARGHDYESMVSDVALVAK